MRNVKPLYRVVAAALLLLTAVPAIADEPKIAVSMRDKDFVPAEIVVPAGVKVELLVRNERAVPAEFESSALHREKIVPPGGTMSVFIGPLTPGRYDVFDDFNPSTRGLVVVK